MSYVVLARRYRPQTFSEIVGQDHIVQIITNAINTSRIHHAFLFTGARGTGKTTSARLLAKALNCINGPTAEPCNVCQSCTDITDGKSVDVLEIDGATNTGVDNVRALREDIRYMPSFCRYRIVIIDEVHMLTTASFNALLKTLEEPPAHVIFIFATTEPQKIPATILSRVQRFDFHRVETQVLADHLTSVISRENFQIEPDAARLIAIQGEGSVRDSLSIMDQVLAQHPSDDVIKTPEVRRILGITDRETLINIVKHVLERNTPEILTKVHELFLNGIDIGNLTKSLVRQFRDFLIIRSIPDSGNLTDLSNEEKDLIIKITKPYSVEHIHHLLLRLFSSSEYISRSYSPKTALEMVLVDMCIAEPLMPLKEIISAIKELPAQPTYIPAGATSATTPVSITAEDRKSSQASSNKKRTEAAPASISNEISRQPAVPTVKPTVEEPVSTRRKVDKKESVEPTKPEPFSVIPDFLKQNKAPQSPVSETPAFSSETPSGTVRLLGMDDWLNIIGEIKKIQNSLGFQLEEAKFSSSEVQSGILDIHLALDPSAEFLKQQLSGRLKTINELVSSITGFPVRVELSTHEEIGSQTGFAPGKPVKSARDVLMQKAAVRRKQVEETIRDNPYVRTLLDDFQGELLKFNVTENDSEE
ncbi:DNA polymerase III subunit gamma/tau [Myxococcota bacterium]|nr:DNA polymerase III subunit gamma/tau [Myxococcota bacterium]MBU1380070.1 DNA polymerase III subunit gamma/tau [Myxococcota bacterium]MBU1495528.1 DNA polymerase III subunit gamma/tau [Myxococcota bacterium]